MTETDRLRKELATVKAILGDLLQERGKDADAVLTLIEKGADPETMRLVQTLQAGSSEEKVEFADGLLWQEYHGWVDGEVESLVDAILDEEVTDGESLTRRMEENTGSSLIYPHDQHLVIYASNSTSEGAQEAEDYGTEGPPDATLATWALLTYRHDVREALDQVGLGGDFDRDEWLEAARAGEYDEEITEQVTRTRRR